MDLRDTLRYLGLPIDVKAYLFGDNQSVVSSATHKLNKRHIALAYHRVRQATASGNKLFTHIPDNKNPADILKPNASLSITVKYRYITSKLLFEIL